MGKIDSMDIEIAKRLEESVQIKKATAIGHIVCELVERELSG